VAKTWERDGAKAVRHDIDGRASALGHRMTWKIGPNSNRKGHVYFFEGVCAGCGAEATARAGSSSCGGVRDARHERCGGPGTAVLTEIEAARFLEVVAAGIQRG